MAPILIAPSIMCANPLRVEDDLRQLEAAGVDLLHFDVMDAHFAPNMPMGLGLLERLHSSTKLPLDVHLMVDNNGQFIDWIAPLGIQQISLHVESEIHLDRTLARIRELGIKAGIALNPTTPLTSLQYVLERLDYVLIMTVNPGFAGQKMVPMAIRKIVDFRNYLDDLGLKIPIQVDGNVSFENIPDMVAAGAEVLVCGSSSVFKAGTTIEQNVQKTRDVIASGLHMRQARTS